MYQLSDDLALVQTVDLFPPVVDDPYSFGAIAAANALSDIYAMGGRPLTALNLVGWPAGVLDYDIMGEVMRGGLAKLAEGGATLVGGHSWDDAEPKYGLAVTGLIDPRRIVTNAGAQPGDALVLTKPLGIGIITTAIKSGEAGDDAITQATAVMSTLNKGAAEAMLEAGVNAATDVTGFGLLGHLREMTSGSQVDAEIDFEAVPVLDAARTLADRGVAPGGTKRNLESLAGDVDFGDTSASGQLLLADAQTSGGLLISVRAERLDTLLAALTRLGAPVAAVIGRIASEGIGRIRVRS